MISSTLVEIRIHNFSYIRLALTTVLNIFVSSQILPPTKSWQCVDDAMKEIAQRPITATLMRKAGSPLFQLANYGESNLLLLLLSRRRLGQIQQNQFRNDGRSLQLLSQQALLVFLYAAHTQEQCKPQLGNPNQVCPLAFWNCQS